MTDTTDQTEEARVRLHIELMYDPRNKDVRTSEVEERVKQMLNHPRGPVADVDIRPGRAAGSVYITLKTREMPEDKTRYTHDRWSEDTITRLPDKAAREIERTGFADNVKATEWAIDLDA